MRGVGGPLLCIGDLLNDVGESPDADNNTNTSTSTSTVDSQLSDPNLNLQPSDLPKLFQENYDQLKEALAGTDHSWTALTLKFCTVLNTADKLIQTANSHAVLLSENIQELERIMKRGDSVIAAAKSIQNSLTSFEGKQPLSNHKQG